MPGHVPMCAGIAEMLAHTQSLELAAMDQVTQTLGFADVSQLISCEIHHRS